MVAGINEVGIKQRLEPTHNDRLPLRKSETALHQSFGKAIERHATALEYLDSKVERAMNQGLFSFRFTLGEVDGLSASSHSEYVAFIQLLDILGYNARYTNHPHDGEKKEERFVPQTVIYLDWLPRKK